MYLAIVSGIFLVLSFPNFLLPEFSIIHSIVAYISLVPFFISIYDEKPAKSFILGFITGYIYFTGGLYWIAGIKELGVLATYTLLLLSFYLAFYVGVFSLLISFIKKEYKLFATSFLWVCLEYVRAHLFSGFPWLSIGYSQYQNMLLIQISSLTGVYGVSFIVVLINSFIAYFFIYFKYMLKNIKFLFLYGSIIFLIVFCSILFGSHSIKNLDKLNPQGNPVDIAILQGNIPQDEKWETENVGKTFEIYDKLSTASKNSLIILPETAIPVYVLYDKKHLNLLLNIAKRQNSYFLTGIPDLTFDKSGNVDKYLNAAILISPQGFILDRYDKIHLVPFGEFTPLKKFISFLEKFTVGFAEFSHGTRKTVFEIDGVKFSTLICYEAIFPHLVRRFVNKGALFLVNITNDAWYGKSSMPYQHTSMSIFRAIENRVYVFRSANTGVSCIIDPYGRVTKYLDIFVRGFLKDNIKILHKKTFYTKYGDVFVYFCIAFFVLIVYKQSIWKVK